MLNIFQHTHSGFRWIVLVLLVAATFKALIKWRSNAPFTEGDRKLNLFTMTAAHLQLVLGLILFFISDKVSFSEQTMKTPITRFFTVEHSVMMLLAIVLITMGYSKSKKATDDTRKFRIAFLYFFIALLILLAGIPWPFRGFGSGWF
jgi:hypothetical protein